MKKLLIVTLCTLIFGGALLAMGLVSPTHAAAPPEIVWREGRHILHLTTADPAGLRIAHDKTTGAVTLDSTAALTMQGRVAGPLTVRVTGSDQALIIKHLTAGTLTAIAPIISLSDSRLRAATATLSAGQQITLQRSNLRTGGDLRLQAQILHMRDNATRPLLIEAGGSLTLTGSESLDIFALAHPRSAFISGGDMLLRSAHPVRGDAHYRAGGHFAIERLDGQAGDLVSPYDPVILADEGVTLGDYSGASLHIIAGSSVMLNSAVITATDTAANTINPANATVINGGGLTLGDLTAVTLSNGTALTVDGSLTPTLDIRAGVDWLALGGSPSNQIIPPVGVTVAFSRSTSAAITVTAGITMSQPAGLVLLTNQFQANGLSGGVSVNDINVGTTQPNSDGGTIVIDSRGDLSAGTVSVSVEVAGTGVVAGNGGQITLLAPNGSIISDDVAAHTLIPGNQSGSVGDGGSVLLAAAGDITIAGGSGSVTTFAFSNADGAAGSGGPISLTSAAGDIRLQDAQAYAFASSEQPAGNGGSINLEAASGGVTVIGNFFGALRADSLGSGVGSNGGNVAVNAASGIAIANAIRANTNGLNGSGGDISLTTAAGGITAGDLLTFATVSNGAAGSGGRVTVEAQSGDITTGDIATSSDASFINNDSADGGSITLRALDGAVTTGLLETFSEARGAQGDTGNGGSIEITAGNGSIATGAAQSYALAAINNGDSGLAGNGGPITMLATQSISVSGNLRTFSEAQIFGGAGGIAANGGSLVMTATTGSISLGGAVATYANAAGDAGNGGDISLTANNGIFTGGLGVFDAYTFSPGGSVGNGGSVTLNTASGDLALDMVNAYAFNPFTGGAATGNGGTISLSTGSGSISLAGSGFAALRSDVAGSGVTGNGGDISLTATGDISIADVIRASVNGIDGNAGNITLTSSEGDINTADLFDYALFGVGGSPGNGGQVWLEAQQGSITTGDVLAYSNAFVINNDSGDGGDITLRALAGAVTTGSLEAHSEARGAQGDTGTAGAITVVAANGSIIANGDWRADALSAINNSGSGAAGSGNDISLQASGDISLTGGLRTASAAVNTATNQPSPVGSASDAGAVDLSAGGDIVLSHIDARSVSPTILGSGGVVKITAGQFFRGGGVVFGSGNTIWTEGLAGSGAITITHGGGGLTPFIVGDAVTNGVTSTLTTGEASLSPTQSLLYSHFEPPNLWIISVTPTLVINEIMKDPAAVNDTDGEWLELYNPGPTAMNLDGCILRDDDTDFHRIDNGGPLLIEAGGYLVLGLNGDSAANGNVPVGYDYDFYFLNNDTDEIILECDGVEIDRVNYDNGIAFPDPTGASMQLVASTLDNNLGANWCESLLPWPGSAGDLGTPGEVNNCLPEPLPDIPLVIYLPLISKSQPLPPPAPITPPDLVVAQLLATTDAVTVVIKNDGTEPVVDAFWVDLYLDPAPPPTGVNQTWQMLANQGVAWGIVAPGIPLEGQEVLTLTLTSAYLIEAETNYTLPLTPGTPVWVQVDSVNLTTDYGGVLEGHEISGEPYNNITSTTVLSGPVVTIPPLVGNQRESVPAEGLPSRP